jgi:VanZ family protein
VKLTNNLLVLNKIYLILALIWTTIVTFLCLINNNELPIPKFEKNTDKLGHMVFHIGITSLWFLYFKYKFVNVKTALIQAFLFSFVYGILIEIAQGLFTATRSADILDVAANTTGALLVVAIVMFYQKKTDMVV